MQRQDNRLSVCVVPKVTRSRRIQDGLTRCHWVDPTGKPERELAEQFRRKAEEVENAGFQRFAVTLRSLAEGYDREAERIIGDHKDRDDD